MRLQRARAQLLHRPAGVSAVDVVERLLAVQAQDLRAAKLALRARSEGVSGAEINSALSEERTLVVGWLGRGTLHLVGAEDYPWLLALTAPARMANSRRRLGQEGVSPDDAERAVAIIERALADEGPLTRPELAERIAAAGIRTEGQATPHLLGLAALRGVAVLGPLREDGAQAFALARDWLGAEPAAGDRDRALAELARRYLRGHGPATAADLASWIGLPLRDARAGLGAIAAELVVKERGQSPFFHGLVDLAGRDSAPAAIAPRLLPAFDPYLLGWKDRSFAVPAEHARRVHPGGGILRATAIVDARAVATWSARRRGARYGVVLEPFAQIEPGDDVALRADAEDVARFIGSAG